MFDDWKEAFLSFITSRIFVLMVLFCGFFGILMSRVFVLQIIDGKQYAESFTMKIRKEVSIASTRGRIFDRNGEVLADNVLSYSVTIEDNGTYQTTREKQATLNRTILKVIDIMESHGDSSINDFGIIYQNGHYAYTQEGTSLLRFKADVYGYKTIAELEDKPEEYVSTADQMMEYLCGNKKYFISPDAYSEDQIKQYHVPTDLTPEQILKLVTVRYQMSTNSYKRYVATTIASDVSDETVAEILENQSELQGVSIRMPNILPILSVISANRIRMSWRLCRKKMKTMRPTISWEKQVSNSIWRQVFKEKRVSVQSTWTVSETYWKRRVRRRRNPERTCI